MSPQALFAQALLQPALPCPPGLTTWNQSDPAARFAVYRNNVMVSLVDALADTYPVVQQLVGDEFFRAMARVYAQAQPPRSAVMAFYGQGFADFVAGFGPAASVPYLADVARLEMARVQAYHAADATPLALQALQAALSDPDQLLTLRLGLHPSAHVIRSRYAVLSIWAAHQDDNTPAPADADVPECALLLRRGQDVHAEPLAACDAVWIEALQQGHTLLEAADAACQTDEAFDFSAALALLLRWQLITHLFTTNTPT